MAELSKAIARLMEERNRERKPPEPRPAPEPPPPPREVADETRTRVAPGERALAEAFARQFAAAPGATEIDERELNALAMVGFRFLIDRSPEEPRVRVFDSDLAHEGWHSGNTVIQIVLRARPFIETTVRHCLDEIDCVVRRLVVATFAVERDPRRIVLSIGEPGPVGVRETLVHIELERTPEPQVPASLLTQRLADLILATDDYPRMRERAELAASALRTVALQQPWAAEADEAAALLDWMCAGNFIFLGYREYQFGGQGAERTAAVKRGSGLGILQNEDQSGFATPYRLPDALRRRVNEPPLVMLTKTNAESPVHRRGYMDYVGIKQVDGVGVVTGERRWIGLWTSEALAADPATIPIVRAKLEAFLARFGGASGEEKSAVITLFRSIPKPELLALSVEELGRQIQSIQSTARDGEVRVSYHPDAIERGSMALVALPRERFSPPQAALCEQRLQRVTGTSAVLSRAVIANDEGVVRLHFYLNASPDTVRSIPDRDLVRSVASVFRTWQDRLRDELAQQYDRARAQELCDRYLNSFPDEYQRETEISHVVRDIEHLEALRTDRTARVDFLADPGTGDRAASVRIYAVAHQVALGDLVASLRNFGLTVLAVRTTELPLPGVGSVNVFWFSVQDEEGTPLDSARVGPLVRGALLRLQRGRFRDDPLNALVLRAHLESHSVDLLRLYVEYAAQLVDHGSRESFESALVRYPQSAQALWEYFATRFDPLDPTAVRDRLARPLPEAERAFHATLEAGQSPSEARVLRTILALMRATVRTNFFRASTTADGGERLQPLAIKIDCSSVPELASGKALFEIYVDGGGVAGLYARAGRVARGGISFSDSPDRLRLRVHERLHQLSRQMGAMVAAAAQGAFSVHRSGRTPLTVTQVQDGCRAFLSAILSLTDNIDQGRITPVVGLVAYDEPDPYLQVSDGCLPDEYSEVARTLSRDREFWMGDALAAGPTRGDAAEVLARGAWESVRRHFQEIGLDAERETLAVVAAGSLSDGAFARGLLLSRRLLVRAAFDDHWILVDPKPDLARSFVERERLVAIPNSTWAHYDKGALGEGGGVFARDTPRIDLSPPVREMLGVEVETVSGDALVAALLKMPFDLLWAGDAGIYVKAADEAHADLADPANDAARIDAQQLQCRAIVEVGPVCTQRGRVAFAVAGGRLNGTAVDGAADISLGDRDSAWSLAVGAGGDRGSLSVYEQERVLADSQSSAATVVVAGCRDRVRALHRDVVRSRVHLDELLDLMAQLEADKVVDRRGERLPDRETVRRRRALITGLTRPELSVLSNAAKAWLRQRIVASDVPDDGFFEAYLREYFSPLINDRCGPTVRSHRLRREVIAAQIANAIVDMMGASFVTRIALEAAVDPMTVVRAWGVVVEVANGYALWREIVDFDPQLPLAAETACWDVLSDAIERATRWLVFTQPPEAAASVLADTFVAPAREILGALPLLQPAGAQQKVAAAVERIAGQGVPRALPQRLVPLQRLVEILDIVQLAFERGRPHGMVAEAYYRLDDLLELDWIEQRLGEQPADDAWAKRALEGLREELISVRRQLTEQVLLLRTESQTVEDNLAEYLVGNEQRLRRIGDLMDEITAQPHVSLAGLLVVVRELRRLTEERS